MNKICSSMYACGNVDEDAGRGCMQEFKGGNGLLPLFYEPKKKLCVERMGVSLGRTFLSQ